MTSHYLIRFPSETVNVGSATPVLTQLEYLEKCGVWRSGGVGLALVVHGDVDVVVQTLLESGHHHLQEDQADKLVNRG